MRLVLFVWEFQPDQSLAFNTLWYVLQPWKCWGNRVPSLLVYFQLEAGVVFACCLKPLYQVSLQWRRCCVLRCGWMLLPERFERALNRESSWKCLPSALRSQEVKGTIWPWLSECTYIHNARATHLLCFFMFKNKHVFLSSFKTYLAVSWVSRPLVNSQIYLWKLLNMALSHSRGRAD